MTLLNENQASCAEQELISFSIASHRSSPSLSSLAPLPSPFSPQHSASYLNFHSVFWVSISTTYVSMGHRYGFSVGSDFWFTHLPTFFLCTVVFCLTVHLRISSSCVSLDSLALSSRWPSSGYALHSSGFLFFVWIWWIQCLNQHLRDNMLDWSTMFCSGCLAWLQLLVAKLSAVRFQMFFASPVSIPVKVRTHN